MQETGLRRMASLAALTLGGPPGSPTRQVVVIETRTKSMRVTRGALKDCECDYFDRALSDPWIRYDSFGRPKLQLDFDSKVFPRTLMCLQNKFFCSPWQDARAEELSRQLHFLGPRLLQRAEEKALQRQPSLPPPPPGFVRLEADKFTLRIPVAEAQDGLPAAAVGPTHTIELTRPFFMQATPVTQAQWQALMGNNPSYFAEGELFASDASDCPVENVSWYDALYYCNALSQQEGLPACYDLSAGIGVPGTGTYRVPGSITFSRSATGYRLPTHAEWRYAASAGGQAQPLAPPDSPPAAPTWASYVLGEPEAAASTYTVARHAANAWGLYDLTGNVFEWVWNAVFDGHGQLDYLDPQAPDIDPRGPRDGRGRVLCGSDYTFTQAQQSAGMADDYAAWTYDAPHRRGQNTGFRPVRAFDPEPKVQGLPRVPAPR
jgi:formylglycine-generating enzyme required for sulfatase activity